MDCAGDQCERGSKPASSGWIRLFWIAIAGYYAAIFLLSINRVGLNDNDQFLMFQELQFWNARLFGFAKQWTPVMVGGISLAGDPQVPQWSLGMALGYLFGPFYGLRVATILYFLFGRVGAWRSAGLIFKRAELRALAASLFIGNGFFVCRLAHGHMDHIPFLALPLVLWFLHRLTDRLRDLNAMNRFGASLAAALALGAGFSVMADGAPVVIIHFYFWVAVYAVVLAAVKRSPAPVLVPALGGAAALLLGAGYLWPMLNEQQEFPRLVKDTFTNPLCLLWFMLLPVGGRVIPAPANGHEYSVYIGPVLAGLIWVYRREAAARIPAEARRPLLVAAVVAILLGMGSLTLLGIPKWLSPFDLLRSLPGFRSMNVTGRYWGFLALPLSLLAAAAIQVFLQDASRGRHAHRWLGLALGLQLAFMTAFPFRSLVLSAPYQPIPYRGLFPADGADIRYHEGGARIYQYDLISPVQGLLDAYNMGDFIHPDMLPNCRLIQSAHVDGRRFDTDDWLVARFTDWNHIQVRPVKKPPMEALAGWGTLTLVFNQAWHRYWNCAAGRVHTINGRNLAVDIPVSALAAGAVNLTFHDWVSARGTRVTAWAWPVWAVLMILLTVPLWRRAPR